MKNKLFSLASALTLVAVIGGVYAAPALAAVIKAALIKNVDEKGRSPYEVTIPCVGATGTTFCFAEAPALGSDRRLVVENVSVSLSTAVGNKIILAFLYKLDGGIKAKNYFHLFFDGTNGSSDYFSANEHVLSYYEPGEVPRVSFDSASARLQGQVTISGYLVDLTN